MGDVFTAAAAAAFFERERSAAAAAAAAMSLAVLSSAVQSGEKPPIEYPDRVNLASVAKALAAKRQALATVTRMNLGIDQRHQKLAQNLLARVAQLERLEELLSAGAAAPLVAASKVWLDEARTNQEDARGAGAGPSATQMLVDDDASARARWGAGAAELGRPPPTDVHFGQLGQFLHEPRAGPAPPPPTGARFPCEACGDVRPDGQLKEVKDADDVPVLACRQCRPGLVDAAARRDGKGLCNACRFHFPLLEMVSCLPAGAEPATAGLFCRPCFLRSGLVRAPKAKPAPKPRKRAAGGGGAAPAPVPVAGFFGEAPAPAPPQRHLSKLSLKASQLGKAVAGVSRAAADTLTGGARRGAACAAAAAAEARGTAEAPIELVDSDDEPGGAAAAAGAPSTSAAAGALRGGRPRRAAAAALAPPPLAAALAGMRCLVPPGGGPGAVELRGEDLARLAPEEFLNDSAIDARLRLLRARLEAEDRARASRLYFFNSFFYKKLAEGLPMGRKPPPLSPEAQALADDEAAASLGGNLPDGALRSLRAFDRVRRWTREVDVFERDYLFIPVHDALHWSLVVVCHPGAAPPPGGAPPGAPGGGGAGEDPRGAPRPHTFLLHLDSMPRGSGHATADAARVVREYLRWEWRARAKAAPGSVAGRWEAAAKGAGAPPRAFDERAAPHARPAVPRQDNSCDCGLFVCAYAEFFAAAAPPALSLAAVEALGLGPKGRRARGGGAGGDDCVDLWERGELPPAHADYRPYPGFLTLRWFEPANAGRLRRELTLDALRGLGAAAGMLDARGGPVPELPGGGAWGAADAARLQALLDGIEELNRSVAREGPYDSPEAYRPAAEAAKRARVAARDARDAAAAARAAAATARERGVVELSSSDPEGERGGGGGPRARPRGRAGGAPDREKIAAAALARESGGRAAASEPDPDFRIILQGLEGMADEDADADADAGDPPAVGAHAGGRSKESWTDDDDVDAAPAPPPRAPPPPGDLAGHAAAMAAAHERVYGAAAARTRGCGAPPAAPRQEPQRVDLTSDVEEEVLEEEEEEEEEAAAAPGSGALGSEEALPVRAPAPAPAPNVSATEPLHSARSAGAAAGGAGAAGGADEATSTPAASRARGKRKAATEPASQDVGAAELPAEEVPLLSESEAPPSAGPSHRAARPPPAARPKPRAARPPPPIPPLTKQMRQKQKKDQAASARHGSATTVNGESMREISANLREMIERGKQK
jgi:hypothetical protein